MNTPSLSAEEVAFFLKENPDFFQEHADVFAELRVPHPNEARAISLGERQILTLRAKAKDLEWRLSGLINNASGNEKISRTLTAWCARMLAQPDANQLPAEVVNSLAGLFELPDTALRVWDIPSYTDPAFTDGVTPEIKTQVNEMTAPYCGPAQQQPALQWLKNPVASIALVPLRYADAGTFGLLVLGAPDAERFQADMGTAFLEILGELASAALSRLKG